MKKAIAILLLFLVGLSFSHAEEKRLKVGLIVMATGKYDAMGVKMIESARRFFLPHQDRTFFIFTDGTVPEANDIVRVEQKRLGWPYDTLKRFHVYYASKELLEKMDYLYAIDADMLFVAEVGDEILGDLVATRHWGFREGKGTYCGNKKSRAYVTRKDRKIYCCGAFYGGKREEFLNLLKETIEYVDTDLKKNLIPKWHDEGYLNRYFIDHPPTVLLSPAYCFPEGWNLPYEPKLITFMGKDTVTLRQ